ncbi:MAG: hypothetical protein A2Z13_03220 [Deltaproteobacteria bacterium RBG_16_64_85]|nr:MAG: hypothetical protein A2Z13_03220 [Deltaproteobacteria bacterium RBG_16_64_85]
MADVGNHPSPVPLSDRFLDGPPEKRGVGLQEGRRQPEVGPVPERSLAGRRGIPREPAGKFHNGNDLFSRGKVRQLVGPAAGKENRRNLLLSVPRHTERGEDGEAQLLSCEIEILVELPGGLDEQGLHVGPGNPGAVPLDADLPQREVAVVDGRQLSFGVGWKPAPRGVPPSRNTEGERLLHPPVSRFDGDDRLPDDNVEARPLRPDRIHFLPGLAGDLRASSASHAEQEIPRGNGERNRHVEAARIGPHRKRREALPRAVALELHPEPVSPRNRHLSGEKRPPVANLADGAQQFPHVPGASPRDDLAGERPPREPPRFFPADHFGQDLPSLCDTLRGLSRADEVQCGPVGGHHAGDVLRASHPPFDLEGGKPQRDELREEIDQGKVARRKNRLLPPFMSVEAPARLHARPAVAGLAPEIGGEEALPRIGVAHRAVHEDLDVDPGSGDDLPHLLEPQVAFQDHPFRSQSGEFPRGRGRGAPCLRADMERDPGEELSHDPQEAQVLHDDGVGEKGRRLVQHRDRLGEVGLREDGVHRKVDANPALPRVRQDAAELLQREVLRPLAGAELLEAEVDRVRPRRYRGEVRLHGARWSQELGKQRAARRLCVPVFVGRGLQVDIHLTSVRLAGE